MIPFTYIISCICSILSYDVARSLTTFDTKIQFLKNSQIPIRVMELLWHCNIQILIIGLVLSPFLKKKYQMNIFDPKVYIQNKKTIFVLMLPILASSTKGWFSSYLKSNIIMIYSLLTPFFVVLFSRVILKEHFSKNYLLALSIGFVGFVMTKLDTLSINTVSFQMGLFGYTILNALSVIAVRYTAIKRRGVDGIVFEHLVYAIQGIICLSIFGGFKVKFLFSWQVLIVTLLTMSHHISVILGNQKAKHITHIMIVDLLKVGITITSCFLFFGNKPTVFNIAGVIVIISSLTLLKAKRRARSFTPQRTQQFIVPTLLKS